MIGHRTSTPLALAALAALLIALAGCQPLPPRTPKPADVTAEDAAAPSTPGSQDPASTAPSTITPSASAVPVADSGEEDCMAGCHIPDPNEHIADGAVPQPASHAGRATCLSCHNTATAPTLPSTHLGRMDPACALCHKPPEAK